MLNLPTPEKKPLPNTAIILVRGHQKFTPKHTNWRAWIFLMTLKSNFQCFLPRLGPNGQQQEMRLACHVQQLLDVSSGNCCRSSDQCSSGSGPNPPKKIPSLIFYRISCTPSRQSLSIRRDIVFFGVQIRTRIGQGGVSFLFFFGQVSGKLNFKG